MGVGMSYPVVVTDQRPQPVHAVIAWVVAVLTLFYMLPWAIAATRGKSTALVIGVVNLLLGWTVIGWIAALVWACTSHRVLSGGVIAPVPPAALPPAPSSPPGPTYSRAYGPPGYSAQPLPPPPPPTGQSYGQLAPGQPPYPPAPRPPSS